jgi:glycosyltransferase involved in cell wall biosynthesis
VREPAKDPKQFDLIVYNSLCALPALSVLEGFRAPVVMWLHELSSSAGLSSMTKLMEEKKDTSFIAVAQCVASSIGEGYGVMDRMTVIPPFIEHPSEMPTKEQARAEICETLGLPENAWIIGAVGWIQWRKGADLFVRLAHHLPESIQGRPVHLVWIGGELERGLTQRLQRRAPEGNRVHFYGHHAEPQRLMPAFDVFVLPSREDPFPIVMLEAALAGCPIVAFAGSGGAEEFITEDIGRLVPFADVPAMANAVEGLLKDPQRLAQMSIAAKQTVEESYLAEQRCSEMEKALLAVLEA